MSKKEFNPEKLANEYDNKSPEKIIKLALENFDNIAISFSGAEDVVLIDIAKKIDCHSIRINLRSEEDADINKILDNSSESILKLIEYSKNDNVSIVVENHGGLSSNGKHLANVMSLVNLDNCGTLPDFGNFCIKGSPKNCNEWYDKYMGVEELMPYAHAVSAKSYHFDENGDETSIDYIQMMDIVKRAGYKGYVGIEYEGNKLGEDEGIIATKKLLEKLI